ncbi:hypothetical protein FQR65_LT19430 [Abscondita terminalis]|nr:hypothetical protein FQR65_LT19430 [Abscondita terminalis]
MTSLVGGISQTISKNRWIIDGWLFWDAHLYDGLIYKRNIIAHIPQEIDSYAVCICFDESVQRKRHLWTKGGVIITKAYSERYFLLGNYRDGWSRDHGIPPAIFVFVGDSASDLRKSRRDSRDKGSRRKRHVQVNPKISCPADFCTNYGREWRKDHPVEKHWDLSSSSSRYERIRNWALLQQSEDTFVTELLDGQPEPPAYFAMMKKLNKVDRPLLLHVPEVPLLSNEQFLKYKQDDVTIVDTRPKELFVKGHIPQSINIQHKKSFATWAGWILKYDTTFLFDCVSNMK